MQAQQFANSLRRQARVRWLQQCANEEAGTFATIAEAHVRGKLAVCAGSGGPGIGNLIKGLFNYHRGRVSAREIAARFVRSLGGVTQFIFCADC